MENKKSLEALAEKYAALEDADKGRIAFQRRARILQSMWRQENGVPIGTHLDRELGSRLDVSEARHKHSNYLTEAAANAVEGALRESKKTGAVIQKPRIYNDLLSSQPLAFNLFGSMDTTPASYLVHHMTQGRFTYVTDIRFEYSPGRSDVKYTGDKSAFDVFLVCRTAKGEEGFIAIEVKYHENLKDTAKPQQKKVVARQEQIAETMGCFRQELAADLRKQPLEQIRRDHLLAAVTKQVDGYEDGLFVFLYPKDNKFCRSAVEKYKECLSDDSTFAAWTLEEVVGVLRAAKPKATWVEPFYDRYLNFGKVDEAMDELAETV